MSHTPIIRPVAETDAATITRIYNHYITSTTVSFETEPLTVHDMLQKGHIQQLPISCSRRRG